MTGQFESADEYKTFDELLRVYLAYVDKTAADLARHLKVPPSTVSNWRRGISKPQTRERVLKIAKFLALSPQATDQLLYAAKFPLEYNTPDIKTIMLKQVDSAGISEVFKSLGKFSFGPYELPTVIIEGYGKESYTRDNIACHYDENNELVLPAELQHIKDKITKESENIPNRWNGPYPFLERWVARRTPKSEEMTLDLWFGLTDYYTYLATNMSLRTEKVYDYRVGRKRTLYQKYFSDYDWSDPGLQPREWFANGFGVVLALLTKDKKLIISKRPADIGGIPNVYNIAI